MQPDIFSKRVLLIATVLAVSIIGFAFVATVIVLTLPTPTIIDRTAELHQAATRIDKTKPGLPAKLTIPAIQVEAAIEQIGLTPLGAMDVPKGPAEAAWFKFGPRPGEKGSSVIAGHYGWKNNESALFDNLNKLRPGDTLTVTDEKGLVSSFVVRSSRSFDQKADATDVFRSTDGQAHLNLVTCEGVWNTTKKSYPTRLVVFTDKVVEP